MLLILFVLLGGLAVVLGALWLERFTKHAGLAFAIWGIVGLLVGGVLLFMRPAALPAIFVVQGVLFLVYYRSRRSSMRVGAKVPPS